MFASLELASTGIYSPVERKKRRSIQKASSDPPQTATQGETERHIERHRDTQRDTERHIERHRERDTGTHRETQRDI